jgi:hypothetical protein
MAKKKLTLKQQSEEACKAEIQAALDKHGCELKPRFVIDGAAIQANVSVIRKVTDPMTGK